MPSPPGVAWAVALGAWGFFRWAKVALPDDWRSLNDEPPRYSDLSRRFKLLLSLVLSVAIAPAVVIVVVFFHAS